MDLFRVRMNCIDHYQSTPTKFDPVLRHGIKPSQITKEPKIPVVRVFGATETGQKVCAHIHGAFPYLYIEYSGSLLEDEVGDYIHRLHLSIDYALAVSYRRNMYDGNAKFVARITLVKGIPFYGFHVGYRFFLKIYMLNPIVMTRLSDLLRQGIIMRKVFQPYEAHLQYLLQWMTDYNLYGCGYIDCSKVTFRGPVPQYDELENLSHFWHDRSIPPESITDDSILPRVSHCSIEVDICVQDILNRQDIKARPLHHDFVERLNPMAPDAKLVHSMAGLWKDETRRRKSRMTNVDPGSSPFPPEVMVSMSADPRNSQPGGWIHEDEYKDKIMSLISEERDQSDAAKLSFTSFIQPQAFESSVKTSLEAVEDLYPENLRPALGLTPGTGVGDVDYNQGDMSIGDVDEGRIMGFMNDDIEDYPYDSDEDVMQQMKQRLKKEGDQVEEQYLDSKNIQQPEHDVDDESRPGGDQYGDQFFDSSDPVLSDFPSSSEPVAGLLAVPLYTQDFGDTKVSQEQQTLAPLSTASSLARPFDTPSKRANSGVVDADSGGHEHKRAKSFLTADLQDGCPSQLIENGEPSLDELDKPSVLLRAENGPSRSARSNTSSGLNSARKPAPKGSTKLSQDNTRPQDSSQTLSQKFPIVKDPHDFGANLRLSHKDGSQFGKSTTLPAKAKHVSFGPSSTPKQLSVPGQAWKTSLLNTMQLSNASRTSTPISNILRSMERQYGSPGGGRTLAIAIPPPAKMFVLSSIHASNLPSVIYQDAFYSNELDVPERPREWAGREFKLESLTVPFLQDFDFNGALDSALGEKPGAALDKVMEEKQYQIQRRNCTLRSWVVAQPPPTRSDVSEWLRKETLEKTASSAKPESKPQSYGKPHVKDMLSQIEGPTQKNKHGFKYTQNQKITSVKHEIQYMSTMSLEVHINTRGNFVPNPEEDEVQCLFWCLQSDEQGLQSNGTMDGIHLGVVVLSEDGSLPEKVRRQVSLDIQEESTELELMIRMVDIVRHYDPDILTGYEVHGGSWGYLIERARLKYDYNLCDEFSRMKSQSHGRFGKENDKWGFNNTSTIRVTGRHMINIWRAMRSELNLLQYTMENVVFHLLHRRIPHFTWADLTKWYTNGKPRDLAKVIGHYVNRVQLDLEILEQNELIPRTSEQARLLGVDFFSVFSRGSQYKVESLMFRIAKPENFLLVSPSRKQVGGQNALECLPLVMEPQSAFYTSPLLVLDFQSLYPSVMIAYNYCYSTFLGRVVNWRGTNKMGFSEYERQQRLLELLKDHINIAPNGVMYTKPEIRKSLLAKMLGEILETRVMVKSGMKVDKDDKSLQRLLNNRQLALKLIANVTYGYTSASFSGRMPCSEIADSIVQTGRETLEKAIALIHSVKRWGAEVVYGDTDSIFVYLKGRTKDQAFDIGEEIAKTVTNMNPRPVKLKFEKVYLPCVLLAKKRYVGFKYENRNQTEPDFDAKGIETVRRDGTPAEQKIEEKALKTLFRTSDLSQVKAYFQQECEKIMKGSVSVQDFCFAREVKLGTYSDKGPPPPGALISTKKMLEDARAEPQYGERVPYVVITEAPGARLIDRCVAPEELLENEHSELDAEYYISKNLIPPLERIFNLVGANVRSWYDEMPKLQRIRRVDANLQLQGHSRELAINKKTLESYMKSSSCLVCKEKLEVEGSICPKCLEDKPTSLLKLRNRLNGAEKKFLDLQKICQGCSGFSPLDEVRCDSKDCPVFYTRTKQKARLNTERSAVEPVIQELSELVEDVDLDLEDLDW